MSDYLTRTEFKQAMTALHSNLDQQFAVFFGKMSERFDRIEKELARKANTDKMNAQFDAIAQRLGIDDQERAAMGHQLNRHQSWINQLATTTGTTLTEVI